MIGHITYLNFTSFDEAAKAWVNRASLVTQVEEAFQITVNGKAEYPVISKKEAPKMQNLLEYTTLQLIELVQNSNEEIEVTSMPRNVCLWRSEHTYPETEGVVWSPAQFIGFNSLYYWQNSLEQLQELMRLLKQDGKAPNFKFTNLRLDGGTNEFIKDYYLVENFLGEPARVSITREWKLIKSAAIPTAQLAQTSS